MPRGQELVQKLIHQPKKQKRKGSGMNLRKGTNPSSKMRLGTQRRGEKKMLTGLAMKLSLSLILLSEELSHSDFINY